MGHWQDLVPAERCSVFRETEVIRAFHVVIVVERGEAISPDNYALGVLLTVRPGDDDDLGSPGSRAKS